MSDVTHLGLTESALDQLGGLWTAREITQQPAMLRETQALLMARRAEIEAFLKPLLVPANSYPKQTAPIASVGSWSFVLTRENLPDDVAYQLAKMLHGQEAALCKKLAQACETTASNTVAAAIKPELIHPGVMKYFREVGVAK